MQSVLPCSYLKKNYLSCNLLTFYELSWEFLFPDKRAIFSFFCVGGLGIPVVEVSWPSCKTPVPGPSLRAYRVLWRGARPAWCKEHTSCLNWLPSEAVPDPGRLPACWGCPCCDHSKVWLVKSTKLSEKLPCWSIFLKLEEHVCSSLAVGPLGAWLGWLAPAF